MKLCFPRLLLLICFLTGSLTISLAHNDPKPVHDDSKSLEFIRNHNQLDASVKFSAALPNGHVFLKQNQIVYSFLSQADCAAHDPHSATPQNSGSGTIRGHAYAVTFLKANKNPEITAALPTPGYRNFFIGDDATKWASDVKAFRQVQYRNVYPGIDVKFYELQEKFKYDFLLQPKANPADIKMLYEGAEKLSLENGNLVIQTSVNKVKELKPYAYQVINGKEKEVPCAFFLKDNTVSFVFPKNYRRDLPLIIDPALVFSSFTGSTANNWGFTATYDNAGNLYSAGIAFAATGGNFPTSPGAFQVSAPGLVDIAIIKYNPNASGGSSRLYATYLGGSQTEAPHSLVVNSQDELIVLGTTSSANFPKTGVPGFDKTFNGGNDIDPFNAVPAPNVSVVRYTSGSDLVLVKLNSSGSALLATTYLGGTGNDGLLRVTAPLVRNYGDQFRGDVTVDTNDNVYIASCTSSGNFPVINGFESTYRGGASDGIACKLSPDLGTLIWSSYIGGSGDDAAYSIQVDGSFNAYICGGTTSANLPQTAGSFKPTMQLGSGQVEGFAAKVNAAGNTLFRTTYIGASPGYDQTYFVQLDGFNNVYLLGQSEGNYPIVQSAGTTGVYSNPTGHQFIQKLSNDLSTGLLSTRFGVAKSLNELYNISPSAFLVDNCERIFICGWGGAVNNANNLNENYVGGTTTGLPVTTNALQKTTDGSDFYLMQLSKDAAVLDYATFFGGASGSGEHVDGGTSRFDKRGFVYQAVCGGCFGNSAFPTTPNAWSNTNQSSLCNNAAFKFNFEVSSAIAGGAERVCENAPAFAITGATPAGGTWSGTGVTPNGIFTPSPALIGSHTLTYTVTVGTCTTYAIKDVNVVPKPVISFTGLKNDEYCISDPPVTLLGSEAGGTFSGAGINNGNIWTPAAAGPGKHIITYTYSDVNGCMDLVRDTAIVAQPIPVSAGPDEGVCAGSSPFQLTGASPAGGVWSGNYVSPTGMFTPGLVPGKYFVTYTFTAKNCTYSDVKFIAVDPAPEVVTTLEFGNCSVYDSIATGYAPLTIKFGNNSTIGQSFIWDFGDGSTPSSEVSPEHTYINPGLYYVKLTTDFGRNCVTTKDVLQIEVVKPFLPNLITPNHDGRNETFIPQVTCLPHTLTIYNRWGNEVYRQENYANEFTGSQLTDGIYYYLIRDSDNRTWKGWVEILK